MAHESALWKLVKRKIEAPGRHLVRVENPIGAGTPDVNYCIHGVEGWIELKEVNCFPKRASTVVKIGHYTPQQRLWIRRRGMSGGMVFLFLRELASMTYMLFEWQYAWEHVGKATEFELRKNALICWSGDFDEAWLLHAITHQPGQLS